MTLVRTIPAELLYRFHWVNLSRYTIAFVHNLLNKAVDVSVIIAWECAHGDRTLSTPALGTICKLTHTRAHLTENMARFANGVCHEKSWRQKLFSHFSRSSWRESFSGQIVMETCRFVLEATVPPWKKANSLPRHRLRGGLSLPFFPPQFYYANCTTCFATQPWLSTAHCCVVLRNVILDWIMFPMFCRSVQKSVIMSVLIL